MGSVCVWAYIYIFCLCGVINESHPLALLYDFGVYMEQCFEFLDNLCLCHSEGVVNVNIFYTFRHIHERCCDQYHEIYLEHV